MPASSLLLLVLVAAPLAAPERLSLTDPHAPARKALADDDSARARALLGEQDGRAPPLVSAPGLYGKALFEAGEKERACALYEADAADHPARAEAAHLRAARCRLSLGQHEAAARSFAEAIEGPVLGREVLVLDEAKDGLLAAGKHDEAVRLLVASPLLDAPAAKDTLRREAHARALLFLAERAGAKVKARALERLYVDLGETPAAGIALKLPESAKLAKHESVELALRRAETLTERHDNAGVFDTLARHQPKGADTSERACNIRLMTGKAARKLRRYQSARQSLDAVAERCSGDTQRRARYLAAQVAYYQSASQGMPLLESFAESYPEDGYTDDVLFWRAELLERQGRIDDAIAGYRGLAERFPEGDMREHARFNLAFLLAQKGDTAGARAVLDEVARTTTDGPPLVRDRALYWRARLEIFPDPMTLTPTADKAARGEGYQALLSFAGARPASFYGHLARLLALKASEAVGTSEAEVKAALAKEAAVARSALSGQGSIPIGTLANDARFQLAIQLASAGYDDEAEQLLDGIEYKKLDDGTRLALVLLYTQVGALAKAHQVMRFSGNALLPGKPAGGSLLAWHLAYPRAYEEAIAAGAGAVTRVPKTLLMGLAREESAFDADVVSWAGAIGLCQLMPPTAREEAQLLKLGAPSLEELRKPVLNARLGANHLSRRMSLLGHPLLAIAAYNAGPGNVAKWRGKDAPKPVDAWVESIPVEQTREYVKKVTGSWVAYEALDGDVGSVSFPLLLP